MNIGGFANLLWRRAIVAVAVALMSGTVSGAAVQRMAVLAGTIVKLEPEAAGVAKAFCLDAARHIPESGHAFGMLVKDADAAVVKFADGPPVPLSTAIAEGKIEVVGNGDHFSVQFVNKTGKKAELEFKKPSPFGDQASARGEIDLDKLKTLDHRG